MPKACLQLISKDPTKKLSVSDKNIFNFLSPSLKLHNQYCHNCVGLLRLDDFFSTVFEHFLELLN